MITSRDTGGGSWTTNAKAVEFMRQRLPFNTTEYVMYGFTDVNGIYVIFSYNKPVAKVHPDGTVEMTKRHVYKNHLNLIETALGVKNE